jgi:hypothetical protein
MGEALTPLGMGRFNQKESSTWIIIRGRDMICLGGSEIWSTELIKLLVSKGAKKWVSKDFHPTLWTRATLQLLTVWALSVLQLMIWLALKS